MEEVEETIVGATRRIGGEHLIQIQCSRCFAAVQYARAGRLWDIPRIVGHAQDRHMECTVNWVPASGMGFVAETGSGHLLTMDGAPDGGGRNLAPRPMETVLAGTAACTAYDVVLILKRGRHAVTGCQVKVDADRADADPKVFTRIRLHFSVTGTNLPEAAVARAIRMSHEKYCSATIMLAKTAEIVITHEIAST
jgi:putative redox protein